MVSAPTTILPARLDQPFYLGSVQRLHALPDHPQWMVSETTEAGSVFDVGSIFTIAGSGTARALFRHVLYERLSDVETWRGLLNDLDQAQLSSAFVGEIRASLNQLARTGAQTHHVGMIDKLTGTLVTQGLPGHPSVWNVVRRFGTAKPLASRFLGTTIYDYGTKRDPEGLMVPLEYLMRFGVTSASSIYRKYQALAPGARKEYLAGLGLEQALEPWTLLPQPILDFSTKYEPEDRALSRQEAALISGLDAPGLLATAHHALLGGLVVRAMLGELGLTLWDLKWEFAWQDGEPVFVDTVDTDSVRATLTLDYSGLKFFTHINKQAMRDYYQIIHEEWYAGINAAKADARARGIPFKEALAEGVEARRYPGVPEVREEFLTLQAAKMAVVQEWLLQKTDRTAAAGQLRDITRKELAFYEKEGKLDALHQSNGA